MWRRWCYLCGNFEHIEKIEPELELIAEKFIEVPSTSFICFDCKAYIQDLQTFRSKARMLKVMFEELQAMEEKVVVSESDLLQVRESYNLKLPRIQIIETADSKMEEYFEEILVAGEEYFSEDLADEVEAESQGFEEEYPPQEIIADANDHQDQNSLDEGETEEEQTREQEADVISENFNFICHVCLSEFSKMCFLSVHTKIVHDCLPSVKCKCGRSIGSVKALIEHYDDHISPTAVKFRCCHCHKGYKTQTHFDAHMATHGDDNRKYECGKCGKTFKEARHLAVHENSHLPSDQKFTHVCDQCDKKYSSIFVLRQHIRHVHINQKIFQCEICEKSFSRRANLMSHVSHVHTDERNFECDVCGLKLKTKGILRVHKKIHSTDPEELLTCKVCQRTFKTQNQLTNHMVCHSDFRKFKCQLCPAEYKRSKELSSHIASNHTGEAKFTCQWCPKVFFNNSNFRKHKLKVHPEMLPETDKDEQLVFCIEIE